MARSKGMWYRVDPDAVEKTCLGCGQVKPLEEFGRHSISSDGRRTRCKTCINTAAAHPRNPPTTVGFKRCGSCEDVKPEDAFGKNKKNSSGFQNYCRECINGKSRDKARRDREFLILELGGACACCGEIRYEFLQIDHKYGNGYVYRNRYRNGNGLHISQLRQHINELQVLCGNCHNAKSSFGSCPHASLSLKELL